MKSTITAKPATLVVAMSLAITGCAQLSDWLAGRPPPDEPAFRVNDAESGRYIEDMYLLTSGDAATQARILTEAQEAARMTADTASRLRLALALATPGHAGSDAERAQSLLRNLVAHPEVLTPTEKSLATIHLRDVEARLSLSAEARRAREAAARSGPEQPDTTGLEQRLAAARAENERLRQALAEAEQKLEAITTIERSMREQAETEEP